MMHPSIQSCSLYFSSKHIGFFSSSALKPLVTLTMCSRGNTQVFSATCADDNSAITGNFNSNFSLETLQDNNDLCDQIRPHPPSVLSKDKLLLSLSSCSPSQCSIGEMSALNGLRDRQAGSLLCDDTESPAVSPGSGRER